MVNKVLSMFMVICILPAFSLIFLAMYQGVRIPNILIVIVVIIIMRRRYVAKGKVPIKQSRKPSVVSNDNYLLYKVKRTQKTRTKEVDELIKKPNWEWADTLNADVITVEGIKGIIQFTDTGDIKQINLANGKTIKRKKVLPDKKEIKDYYLTLITPKIQELTKLINNEGGSYTFNIVDFEGKKNSARDRKLFVEVLDEIGFISELNGMNVTIKETL